MAETDLLNGPEQLLKSLYTFRGLARSVFSDDLTSDIPAPDDPQALHAGFLGDLVSQAGRIGINAELVTTFVQTARNGGLTDDKKYLVGTHSTTVMYTNNLASSRRSSSWQHHFPATQALPDSLPPSSSISSGVSFPDLKAIHSGDAWDLSGGMCWSFTRAY